ncbi:MAG TPA: YciI family protein [Devosia sp.]|nr:YciI family protein [Devosia sp.]
MTRYLVAIHHPDDFDPASETEATRAGIAALNQEMVAAGIRVFVGGLKPAPEARAIRLRPGGPPLVTDGPYMETKERIGGFWVLECMGMDEAVEWGRKAALACRTPVEVREFW